MTSRSRSPGARRTARSPAKVPSICSTVIPAEVCASGALIAAGICVACALHSEVYFTRGPADAAPKPSCNARPAPPFTPGLSQDAAPLTALLASLICSYGMQPINFAASWLAISDNFTGLVEFLPAALFGLHYGGVRHARQVLLTMALAAWSLRLGGFLLYRMQLRSSTDGRFREMRANGKWGALLLFWAVHGTWGFVVSLPVTLVNVFATATDAPINALDLLGLGIWAAGFYVRAGARAPALQGGGRPGKHSSS